MSNDTDPIFDLAGTLERMAGDRELFREMAILLEEDAPRHVASIEEQIEARNVREAARAAHTLKGLVSMFGAAQAESLAVDIERVIKMEDFPKAAEMLVELRQAVNDLLEAVAEEREAS